MSTDWANKHNIGDCRDLMRRMVADGVKVQCVVTSPPYWGLRDYGVAGQLGLEPLHDCLGWATGNRCGECHVCHMVEVFGLVRELLTDDGTAWINYGDSYYSPRWNGGIGANSTINGKGSHEAYRQAGRKRRGGASGNKGYEHQDACAPNRSRGLHLHGLKPKDLVCMPWRIGLALQADGWYLRQDIVWRKLNPLPESVTDRCTKAHEYVLLLSKSERYYFDADAIKEPASDNTHPRLAGNGVKVPSGWDTSTGNGGHGSYHRNGRAPRHLPGNKTHKGVTAYANGAEEHRTKSGLVKYSEKMRKLAHAGSGIKNNDSMDAALAVMPDTRNKRSVWSVATQPYSEAHFAVFPPALIEPCVLAGSRVGDIVLDPFGGSGTTGEVAQRLGRRWILLELQQNYERLIKSRTSQCALQLEHTGEGAL